MDYGREFEKYATKHRGISSTYYNQDKKPSLDLMPFQVERKF